MRTYPLRRFPPRSGRAISFQLPVATAGMFDLEFQAFGGRSLFSSRRKLSRFARWLQACDRETQVGLNKRPLNAGSDRRNEFNIAKTESHSYRPRFLSDARVQRHSSVGRRQSGPSHT